jgi:hypothetical protein
MFRFDSISNMNHECDNDTKIPSRSYISTSLASRLAPQHIPILLERALIGREPFSDQLLLHARCHVHHVHHSYVQ